MLALADGEEAARSGTRIVGPPIAAPVGGEGGHGTLLWHEGQFYLQHELPVTDGQERLGSLIAQQPLDGLGRTLTGNPTSYATAEFLLCSTAAAVLSCFPSRLSPTPVSLTGNGQGSSLFAQQAQATGRGAGRAIDHRGRRVISAYTVVAGHQLAASLKIDLDEAFAPLRRQLALAFALVATVTGAGVLLMRHKVRPLAARLETAVRQRTAQLEEAAARLSESEAQVSAVVESAMDAMVTVGEDHNVVMFNTAAEKMFGCSAAEARGKPMDRFIPERFRAHHRQHILDFGRNGTSARLRVERGTPILALHADGREFPVEATISQAIVKGRKLFTAVVRDVTERRRAEEAQRSFSGRLQALRRLDRSILSADTKEETAQAAVDSVAGLLRLRRASVAEYDLSSGTGAWLAVSGHSSAGTAAGQVFPLELMGDIEGLASGRVQTIAVSSVTHLPAGGEAAEHGAQSYQVVPLIVGGELIGSLNISRSDSAESDPAALEIVAEVADQLAIALHQDRLRERIVRHAADLERLVEQRTHELAQANLELSSANTRLERMLVELDTARREQIATKDGFLSHASHELRTPLSAIYQFATLLGDGIVGELTADQRECVDVVVRNAGQLRGMIDDLLEATRTDLAVLRLRPQPGVSVASIVRDVVSTLGRAASEKGLTLTHEMPADLPCVHADPARVRQILINLVDNAMKFASSGGVRLAAIRDPDMPDRVRISVSDDGRGLTAEQQAHVFERLYQVPGAAPSAREGLGLGLYICKELVERHGGTIRIVSEIGVGSTFSFTLPVDGEPLDGGQGAVTTGRMSEFEEA